MSWQDKNNADYIITTGDGRSFTVLWRPTRKVLGFQLRAYEFPDIEGTLIRRRMPKGRRIPLDIIFQGEDHLDQAAAFEQSARDPNPWQVTHPYYGELTVQPESLEFINSDGFNVTTVQGVLLETITEDGVTIDTAPEDKILADKTTADDNLAESYSTQVQPTTKDITTLKDNNLNVYNEGRKKLSNAVDTEGYINAFNTAQSAVDDAVSEPLAAMRKTQSLLNKPFQFADTVKNRLNVLKDQFDQLRNTVSGITSRNGKKGFEAQGGTIIGAMAAATVTNFSTTTDYGNRTDILQVVTDIVDTYNNYLTDLDSLQSTNGGSPDSYIPDFDGMIALATLVSFTVGNLYRIAEDSKQERVMYTQYDTNAVALTDQLYGIATDEQVDYFKETNKLSLTENIIIKKGRRILYYV